MNRVLFIAILCFLVVSSASAKIKVKDKPPATATVVVDCAAEERITDALAEPAVALTIQISGICEEDVEILRNFVTLRGTTGPLTDGIRPAPGGLEHTVITVFGVHSIVIENLSLTGANTGIGINASYHILVNNCLIETHKFGEIAGTGSNLLTVQDTVMTVTAGGDATIGILLAGGSYLTCTRCTIDNRDAIRMDQGSAMSLYDSTVRGTQYGVLASGGSQFLSWSSIPIPITSTIEGGHYALRLNSNASAVIDDYHIKGRIWLAEKSVATLTDADQVNSSNNTVNSGSSLVARGSTSLVGDFDISEFSDVTLPSGSTVSGGLFCSLGADAVCDDPSTATLFSDCAQCPPPPP